MPCLCGITAQSKHMSRWRLALIIAFAVTWATGDARGVKIQVLEDQGPSWWLEFEKPVTAGVVLHAVASKTGRATEHHALQVWQQETRSWSSRLPSQKALDGGVIKLVKQAADGTPTVYHNHMAPHLPHSALARRVQTHFMQSHQDANLTHGPQRRLLVSWPGSWPELNDTADGGVNNQNTVQPNGLPQPTTSIWEQKLHWTVLNNYDSYVYPWHVLDGPVNVSLLLTINGVSNIKLKTGQMDVSVVLQMTWFDPRLQWDPAGFGGLDQLWLYQWQALGTEMWIPDMTLYNAREMLQSTLACKHARVRPNGTVTWSRNGKMKVACNFKGLSAFPFGMMSCQLELGSWVLGPRFMHLQLQPPAQNSSSSSSVQGHGYTLSTKQSPYKEYRVAAVTVEPAYTVRPCCVDDGEWQTMVYTLYLEPRSVVYVLKIMIPQVVLTFVGFSTFWLSPECGERFVLAITVPLAVAFYDLLAWGDLPASNKVLFISAFGIVGFLFNMAALIANMISLQLYHYRETHLLRQNPLARMQRLWLMYREQRTWTGVVELLQALRLELTALQLSLAASLKAAVSGGGDAAGKPSAGTGTTKAKLLRAFTMSKTGGASSTSSGGGASSLSHDEDRAPLAPPDEADEDSEWGDLEPQGHDSGSRASPLGHNPSRVAARGRWRAAVAVSRWGVPPRLRSHAEGGDDVSNETSATPAPPAPSVVVMMDVRYCTLPQLQAFLSELLSSEDPGLRRVRRRIQRAVLAFGMRRVAARLRPMLFLAAPTGGGGVQGDDDISDMDDEEEARHAAEFRQTVGEVCNRKWRLLSGLVDYVCRYLFVVMYTVVFSVLLGVKAGSYD